MFYLQHTGLDDFQFYLERVGISLGLHSYDSWCPSLTKLRSTDTCPLQQSSDHTSIVLCSGCRFLLICNNCTLLSVLLHSFIFSCMTPSASSAVNWRLLYSWWLVSDLQPFVPVCCGLFCVVTTHTWLIIFYFCSAFSSAHLLCGLISVASGDLSFIVKP